MDGLSKGSSSLGREQLKHAIARFASLQKAGRNKNATPHHSLRPWVKLLVVVLELQ